MMMIMIMIVMAVMMKMRMITNHDGYYDHDDEDDDEEEDDNHVSTFNSAEHSHLAEIFVQNRHLLQPWNNFSNGILGIGGQNLFNPITLFQFTK